MHPVEELIRANITPRRGSSSGWLSVMCLVCNDHGKKGPRAGFRFDGECIGYNCFNCQAKFSLRCDAVTASKRCFDILECYGITQDDLANALLDVARSTPVEELMEKYGKTTARKVDVKLPDAIPIPKDFHPLTIDINSPNMWVAILSDYAIQRRIDKVKLMWCDGTETPDYLGRLIVPFYRDGQLIFYTGRDATGQHPKKYLSPPVMRDSVFYNWDALKEDTQDPLYVLEGMFDSILLGGVAILGNVATPQQIQLLNQCPRKKIVIPDLNKTGLPLAKQAVEQGWAIAFPDIGASKDISEAAERLGLLFIRRSIKQNTLEGPVAEATMHALLAG